MTRIADGIELIEGDCLEVLATLGRIDAILSDPPYGMAWDTDTRRFSGGERGHRKPGEGRDDWGDIADDDRPFDPSPWLDFPKVILWGANHFGARLPVGTTLVWVKREEHAFGSFLSDAEVGWMKGGHGVYLHKNLSMNAIAGTRSHPSQKPVGLMSWCLRRLNLPPGATILDPYCGSGTTGIAAIKAGLNFIGIECDPGHFRTAVRRITAARTPLFDGVAS